MIHSFWSDCSTSYQLVSGRGTGGLPEVAGGLHAWASPCSKGASPLLQHSGPALPGQDWGIAFASSALSTDWHLLLGPCFLLTFFFLFLIYFFFLTLGFPGRTLVAEKMPYCIYWWVSLNFKVTQIIQRSGHTIEQKTDTANIIICKSLRKSQVKSEDAVSLKWTWIADSERWY